MHDISFPSHLSHILKEKWHKNFFTKLTLHKKLPRYFAQIRPRRRGGYTCFTTLTFVIIKGNKIFKMFCKLRLNLCLIFFYLSFSCLLCSQSIHNMWVRKTQSFGEETKRFLFLNSPIMHLMFICVYIKKFFLSISNYFNNKSRLNLLMKRNEST